ncbi:hypothetical protein BOTNAR_0010g00310 [Botryotinia narcissicola]|uniref:Uncharacterized protein n=1 Tax=Botryotinia narcissicola TaxID=278944 RepID=A0A4Z1J8H0_9HELO|nr:hypothetical protein BOTNAR_0010g00310 [Botryotinia narcissicola]
MTWKSKMSNYGSNIEDCQYGQWSSYNRVQMSLRTTKCRIRYTRLTTWDMAVIVALAMDAKSQFSGKAMVGCYRQRPFLLPDGRNKVNAGTFKRMR